MMRRIKEFSVASAALLGLLVAMSDSPYFPWANLAGIAVMALIAFTAQMAEERRNALQRIDDQITRRLREIDRENVRRLRLLRYRRRAHG